MRLFFALEIPAGLALRIAAWRERMLPPAGRPVPPASFHITLAFLGELDPRRLDGLCTDVERSLSSRPAPGGSLQLDQVGYWPRPGIYWLGPSEWPESLGELARTLSTLGKIHGVGRKRDKFQPHVTLLRSCRAPPPAPTADPDFTYDYNACALMESRQGRRGFNYHPVAHWRLGDGTL